MLKKQIIISRILAIMVMLALIRCIAEIFRLHYYNAASITYEKIEPFMLGALVTSVASLILNILFYFAKYKIAIAVSTITIISLFVLKYIYKT